MEIINPNNSDEGQVEAGGFKAGILKLREWLSGLSFRTGMIVLLSCIPFYILSFAQFALPIPLGLKTALWIVFFGMAKTAQYGGLTILGAKSISRLLRRFQKRGEG